MRGRTLALLVLAGLLGATSRGARAATYPLHESVPTTVFWVGEPPSPGNGFIANAQSAWDELWLAHFEADQVVYWAGEKDWADDESMLKNRWIRIEAHGKAAYAQCEVVGPFGEDDAGYVFGSDPPANPENGAGLDVSPAVADHLGLEYDVTETSWRFVEAADVTPGSWRDVVTNSDLCYLPDCLRPA
ncbi:MAG: hypothetical protein HY775_12410 [Acidobacteria bacterium]|nr:hypothetical protein [Acidobacteriota bacterium]